MPKISSATRLQRAERAIRSLRAEVRSLRRDLDDRTRKADRIGFEVCREERWDIGDFRPQNVHKKVWGR